MKGVIFTSFIDLVEERFGLALIDEVIVEANLPNNGAYTTIGTYDYRELISMIDVLSMKTGVEVNELTRDFGEYLFTVLAEIHPLWLTGIFSSFELLERLDDFIHVEVKKLYPDAKPPKFTCQRISKNQLGMIYSSPRCLGGIAEGLIYGCAGFYGEVVDVEREVLGGDSDSTERFSIRLH